MSNVVVARQTTQPVELALEFVKCEFPILPAFPTYAVTPGNSSGLEGMVRSVGLHKPVRGVRIDMINSDTGDVVLSTWTDRHGAFVFVDAIEGEYTVKATNNLGASKYMADFWPQGEHDSSDTFISS